MNSGKLKKLEPNSLIYLAVWSKNPAAYLKKKNYCQDSTTKTDKSIDDEENIEVVLVDGLFEMFKLREEMKRARSEIIAESVILSYNHKFVSLFWGTHLAFRSSIIEKVILPKRVGFSKENRSIKNCL